MQSEHELLIGPLMRVGLCEKGGKTSFYGS